MKKNSEKRKAQGSNNRWIKGFTLRYPLECTGYHPPETYDMPVYLPDVQLSSGMLIIILPDPLRAQGIEEIGLTSSYVMYTPLNLPIMWSAFDLYFVFLC